MPNIVSVERLARFYESDRNFFSLIMIKHSVDGIDLEVSEVLFVPIEFPDGQCLTVGALGWGQIQIANSDDIQIIPRNSRKTWMLQLCATMMDFYPREMEKIVERRQRFETIKDYWANREDVWLEMQA